MKIPINLLKTCPINSEIYRDSDVGDLVNSIGEVGLLQPIVVTPDNTIISGHRRYKAIQSLGWTEVEVEVKEVDDDSIPLYVVLFNQSRNKVASELIREIMVLMDSRWIGQGNWNRGKSDQMITFTSIPVSLSDPLTIHKNHDLSNQLRCNLVSRLIEKDYVERN